MARPGHTGLVGCQWGSASIALAELLEFFPVDRSTRSASTRTVCKDEMGSLQKRPLSAVCAGADA